MNNFRRLGTLSAGLALSVLAFAATAPSAFAIIPGPAHTTTVDAKYVPPVPVTTGRPAARQTFSNAKGHPVATGPASVPVGPRPGQGGGRGGYVGTACRCCVDVMAARHHGRPGRPARHEARRQPGPAPVLPAAGHTGINAGVSSSVTGEMSPAAVAGLVAATTAKPVTTPTGTTIYPTTGGMNETLAAQNAKSGGLAGNPSMYG
jgi:hypothetical protein